MYVKKRYLIIVSLVILLLIGGILFPIIYLTGANESLVNSYEKEIVGYENALADYGPMDTVWTVSSMTLPGHAVKEDELEQIKMLKKSIGKHFITDKKKIIGKYYKISIAPGTPLTEELFMEETIKDTTRQYEVISTTIPVGLQVGDYIDYRFVLPWGQDYIVMSHKRVEGLYDKVITLNLTEEEIHTYQSLVVDYCLHEGSQIYMTKYLEPGIQEPAKKYYPVSTLILKVLTDIDPNVTEAFNNSISFSDRVILLNALDKMPQDLLPKVVSGKASIQSSLDGATSQYSTSEEMKKQQANAEAVTGVDDGIETSSVPLSDQLKQNEKSDESKENSNSGNDVPKTESTTNGKTEPNTITDNTTGSNSDSSSNQNSSGGSDNASQDKAAEQDTDGVSK